MKTKRVILCLMLIAKCALSQNAINGTVTDSSTLQPVPYAAVGIAGTRIGTLCDEQGNFNLLLPHFTDTLRISSVGYDEHRFPVSSKEKSAKVFYLRPQPYTLPEVNVTPKNMKSITLGTAKYNKKICTAFVGENENWKGEQAAIRAVSKPGRTVYLETFGFYIVKNEYSDSLRFRLMLYEVNPYGYPGRTFLKKPIVFKIGAKQGEVQIDIRKYDLTADGDLFISLECLEDKMEASKFCFAGSVDVPSFFKTSPFNRWSRVRGGGGDFNISGKYVK